MRENYSVWETRIDEFNEQISKRDKLKFLVNFAILAPSSHNSQPWSFRLVGDEAICVEVETARQLAQSDTNNRQLYISLGCALANILVAADYYGYTTETQFLPKLHGSNCAAIIRFSAGIAKNTNNHLIYSIFERTNNRNRYENRQVDKDFLEKIKGFRSDALEIDIVTTQSIKHKIADAVLSAGEVAMSDNKFRNELSRYVKNNITKSKTGMPGFGLGIPTPPSLLAPFLVKYLNMNRITHKKDELLLKVYTPAFVIISTKNDSPFDWLNAGLIYQKIALMATKEGLQTAVWAAAIQIGSYYQELQKNINTTFRPQVFFRLGYTKSVPKHSPRFTVDEVIK